MQTVSLDALEADSIGTDAARRRLSEALHATHVAINHYRLGPGEGLPGGLHAHMDQEEVFLVLEGEATFETLAGTVTVGEGEAVRFGRGEFQSGRNESDGEVALLALGAPRGTGDVRIPAACPDCGHDDLRIDAGDHGIRFVCPDCESEHVPSPCPECGGDDLRITRSEGGGRVVVCQECGAEYDEPPLRD